MENISLCGSSVSNGKNSEATCNSTTLGDHDSIDKLSSRFSGCPRINEGNRTSNTNDVHKGPVDGYDIEDEEEEDEEEEEDDLSQEALLEQMGYGKAEPKRDLIDDDEEEEEDDEDLSEESILAQMGYLKNEPPKHEPITMPTAELNLMSAFKGSRKKEGKLPKQCQVSWAPDVYDPPPTSDDHYVANKIERHKSEHKVKGAVGKNRQKCGSKWAGVIEDGGVGGKGKDSKGGGNKGSTAAGKDKVKKHGNKKQAKKRGGGASKYSDGGEY